MTAIAAYLLTVVVVPALVPTGAAVAIGRARIGRTPGFAAAIALSTCVLWSFVAELDLHALLRQLPVELEGDDAPIERWHRIGLVALVSACIAPVAAPLNALARWSPIRRAALGSAAAGGLLAAFVAFPGDTPMDRLVTAVTCAVSAVSLVALQAHAAMATGAVAAWSVAGLAAATSFPSLAVIAGSLGLASAALAVDAMRPARGATARAGITADPVVAVVLATALATLASCGHAYSDGSVPGWGWRTAAVLPVWVVGAATLARKRLP